MRYQFRLLAVAAAATVIQLAATPANAVVTSFATFTAAGEPNLRWVNSDGAANTGSGGSFFSIVNPSDTGAASTLVNFSFINIGIAGDVTNVSALLTLNASAPTGNPATPLGPFTEQGGIGGTFSFTTTSAIFVPSLSTFFAAGSNLLSGTFGGASILTLGGIGGFSAATSGGDTLGFVSDFLDFGATTDRSMDVSLGGVSPGFSSLSGAALSGFTATGRGTFSYDAPALTPVPEPATWGLMILGFGVLGARLRRRRSGVVAV